MDLMLILQPSVEMTNNSDEQRDDIKAERSMPGFPSLSPEEAHFSVPMQGERSTGYLGCGQTGRGPEVVPPEPYSSGKL